MANSGKFSSFVARSNNSGIGAAASNRASTSAAAAAAANQFSNDDRQSNSNTLVTSHQGKTNNNGNNLSLAKYKSGGTGNEEIMRLVTERDLSYSKEFRKLISFVFIYI